VEKVAGGVTTSYTYDDEDILREVRGATTLKYVHGRGFDAPLAVDDGTAHSYFHADALGSIVKVTNASGVVTLTRRYDSWGNLEAGATEPGYAFTARDWDPEVDLYYFRARYMDARTGRFLSEDPIGWDADTNFYRYVWSNPVNFADPDGLLGFPGNYPAAKTPICIGQAFSEGKRLGDAIGYRYGHCMAACLIKKKCGQPEWVARQLGNLNEVGQTVQCFGSGYNCGSANAPVDYEDNRTGYTCPDKMTCEERCSDLLLTPKKEPYQMGPYPPYFGPYRFEMSRRWP